MKTRIERISATRVFVNNRTVVVYGTHIINDGLSDGELKALDWFLRSPLKIKSSVFDDNKN